MREPDSHEQGGSSHLALLLTSKTRVPDHEQHLARVRQQSREGPPPPVVAVARGSVPLHLVPVEPVRLCASAEDEGRILYGCLDPGETLV